MGEGKGNRSVCGRIFFEVPEFAGAVPQVHQALLLRVHPLASHAANRAQDSAEERSTARRGIPREETVSVPRFPTCLAHRHESTGACRRVQHREGSNR